VGFDIASTMCGFAIALIGGSVNEKLVTWQQKASKCLWIMIFWMPFSDQIKNDWLIGS